MPCLLDECNQGRKACPAPAACCAPASPSILARLIAWMKARSDRKLLARVISEADAALEARGRGDMEAYRRHASLAQALSARRRG